ncbi:uncharacterized protein BYT42DRAFT_618301 [Radiomyces spectabilis]|uniref:uncharacterized protein n=1 Tax=Radiomyces spectabilis TaxID=64574 RepID=UPI002220954A|nr:uncharacterized protein BYT42DRAFT_618301 [Radiomyces spectabilis]KAI8366795.1 hypothetical protein BYT42DRAFT_618301 [Radiomyces spectabilis]
MSTSETLILQAANVNPLGHNSCHTSIELSKPTSVSDPLPKDGLKEESSTATDSALKKPVSTLNPNARPWKPFWSAELQVLANERDRMYRRWRRAVGLYKVYPYLAYKEARDTFQKAVRSAKRQVWRASQDTVAKTQIEKKMIKLCESVVFIYPVGQPCLRMRTCLFPLSSRTTHTFKTISISYTITAVLASGDIGYKALI